MWDVCEPYMAIDDRLCGTFFLYENASPSPPLCIETVIRNGAQYNFWKVNYKNNVICYDPRKVYAKTQIMTYFTLIIFTY
jgi:hypothetical protein